MFILERWLCFIFTVPTPSEASPPRQTSEEKEERGGKGDWGSGAWCLDKWTARTGYRGPQPVGVSAWPPQSSHTYAHICAHSCGSVPAGGQSLPSSYTFILSFPTSFPRFCQRLHPSTHPSLKPRSVLHPSFLPLRQPPPLFLFVQKEKKVLKI